MAFVCFDKKHQRKKQKSRLVGFCVDSVLFFFFFSLLSLISLQLMARRAEERTA